MRRMFNFASRFNQDLCGWGIHYNAAVDYRRMFEETSCPNEADPSSASGPWCRVCPEPI